MDIYHCPFCGGKAPKSHRDDLFHRLSLAEKIRLSKSTKDLHTIDDVIAALGEPDIREPTGVIMTTPERDGNPEKTQVYPMMTYTGLSKAANVVVTVYANDSVRIHFEGKEVKANVDS